jgi:hypothetical protein
MKKKITFLLFLSLLITGNFLFAQYTVKQVIVLNQGPYGGPVTVGSYDPVAKTYQNFDSLPQLRFASYVIIDNGFIYVAADSLLIKYDLNTKQKLFTQTIQGIREIAVWKNQLLVTRGQTNSLPSYFQAYGKDSLNFIYELSSVTGATEGIKVLNDTAYLAINNFWGTVGKLAVIDLNARMENREIDLGSNGLNPYNVEVERSNGTIYTVNNLNYTNSSVTKYDASTTTFTNTLLDRSNGCSGSTYYGNNIYFQTSGEAKIMEFSTTSLTVWDSLLINKSFLGIAIDSVNSRIYIGNTDYTTYGKVYIYTLYGALKDSFSVNVAPGNFAFDVRTAAGIQENSSFAKLFVYPNPATDQLHVSYTDAINQSVTLIITDITGREICKKQIAANVPTTISIADFAKGVYLLKAATAKGIMIEKIVKK